MRRHPHVVVAMLVCWGGLALVSLATGARSTADASAVIAGSGTSYTLTWTAGGDEALRCMGLILLPGEVPTGATGPAEWTIRVLPLPGDAQGRWVVHATKPPPGLAPGGSLAIPFTTQAPLAPNQPREIRFSSTCVVGSDIVKQSSGPTAPPRPPPPPPPSPRPKPCACESLDVQLGSRISSAQDVHLDLDWGARVHEGGWRMPGEAGGRAVQRLEASERSPHRRSGGHGPGHGRKVARRL